MWAEAGRGITLGAKEGIRTMKGLGEGGKLGEGGRERRELRFARR